MELKVWVEGIQRIVCGVTTNTTCQDVVFALAHATGATGRFSLLERGRNNERLLAPNENPLKLLLKWGEYANDVQFILQRSENRQQTQQQLQQQQQRQQQQQQISSHASNNMSANDDAYRNAAENAVMNASKCTNVSNNSNNAVNNNNNNNRSINNNSNNSSIDNSAYNQQFKQQHHQKSLANAIDYNFNTHHYDKSKELSKSFGADDIKSTSDNIGIVHGIPQHNNLTRMIQSPTTDSSPQRMQISPLLPQQPLQQEQRQQPNILARHEKSHSNPIEMTNNSSNSSNKVIDNYNAFHNKSNNNNIYHQIGAQNSKSINEINLAEVRNALDRRANQAESMEITYSSPIASSKNNNTNSNHGIGNLISNNEHSQHVNDYLLDVYNGNVKLSNASPDLYKNAPTISSNGALVPPPYRNPPPPRNSPLQQMQVATATTATSNMQYFHARNTNLILKDYNGNNNNNENNSNKNNPSLSNTNGVNFEFQNFGNANNVAGVVGMSEESESIFQASQYSDLLQLIKLQREKISAQQMELSKFDAEICFLETKERDQAQQLEAIAREITKADQIYRQGSEQLQTLQYVEEENELVKQQEKTLKSEIALLRSKLANCETELLQCKNKMRLLMDDIEIEQRDISNLQKTNRQNVERDFLMEMDRIQSEIDQAILNTDSTNKTAENLKKEITSIENAIADKKRQLEQLINEMKEVNLQSLTVTASEEIKHLLEGPNKLGSTRRIIGSPRQLENAVPTSKNPHGVWV